MVKAKAAVPDAWDDDWETLADREEDGGVKLSEHQPEPEQPTKLSKAQLLERHKEENKKLWQEAETPDLPIHILATPKVPLAQQYKPAMRLLSRKPANVDLVEEEKPNTPQLTPEELRAKAQREREVKQRKYEEARARILGTGSGTSSGAVTPPDESRYGRSDRGRGRGRGNSRNSPHLDATRGQDIRRPDSGQNSQHRELFDPNYTAKPGAVSITLRGNDSGPSSGQSTPRRYEEEQVLRMPRNPESGGRGGFGGFAKKQQSSG